MTRISRTAKNGVCWTMKRKRFSVEQIVAALKQVELGMSVADACRQFGVSEQTFYRWKRQYSGLQSEEVRELKQLREENSRLKKLVADLSLDKAILQDINAKKWPGPRRDGRRWRTSSTAISFPPAGPARS